MPSAQPPPPPRTRRGFAPARRRNWRRRCWRLPPRRQTRSSRRARPSWWNSPSIARRLVADLPSDARAVALARTALAEHRDGSRLALRAPPATASVLRAAFAAHGNLDVRDDDTLGPDECVLLHPGGRTELGPLQQLRALMAASAVSDPAR